ncbi:double-strand break repair helicase AddA [Tropicimonas isoalkanivorans]|uniref:DNA 3'-5' helicase n=1 Tax=Tropicimonas isoalkanivorans TaxID=441112 RepID=A0A1I1M8E8_9RHOB|nr:double-strand break repair helicase AddA [Tropicimonas isoalkanivorans]SFC81495.1 DNA helicase/exodeoxyribonuclease V, subunit A [Tropicimonas isoalkanivorans]
MTAHGIDDATRHQMTAADPRSSTWLSANAGSGKTRVLTDRVARLLLDDVPPQNILCLTYTKAAASEMQNRLFQRLGDWAMREDVDLRTALGQLGVEHALSAETLAKARRLFARAIETPGGLKIQTIHSFCAGLLRRFPLEAGVSPGFTELDEEATASLQTEVLDTVAEHNPEVFAEVAALVGDADLTGLASEISAHRTLFPARPDRNAVLALFDLPAGFDAETALAEVLADVDAGELRALAGELARQTATTKKVAESIFSILSNGLDQSGYDALADLLLRKADGQPKSNVVSAKRRAELGPLETVFDELCARVSNAAGRLKALEAARRTLALYRFAAAFLPEYARRKDEGGWLDFDDQIERAEALLAQPEVADWVLYKLDGGIDHILVDEAQDTSPLQWQVIEHLTREFTSGAGSAEVGDRSIFVVGDLKQSIYSFQGADPAGFIRMRQAFADRLEAIDLRLQQLELKYSFRSSGEILRAVDCTFGQGDLRGMGDAVSHIAFKGKMPGRVDLWPLEEKSEKADDDRLWYDPVDHVSDEHHTVRLARKVAAQVREMVRSGFLWEEAEGAFRERPITEGDVLILVQSRGPLFHEIIRACKVEGLEVAGADVLKLGEELAVRDIRALLSFLSTPEDDLSLAATLRSPLFGWSEAELYDLATERGPHEFVWQALRRRQEEFAGTHAVLRDLRDLTDYLRPYDLIERLLTRHDGRRRLVARLGEEASDGIDSLLAQALDLEQAEPLSLTGFLARMEGADVKVKRRAEGRGAKIRVMTVHGAKGLESPIVILPDTGFRKTPREFKGRLLPGPDGVPCWSMPQAEGPANASAWKQAAVARQLEEAQRLLYVAMTRAEQWLIVAAAGDLGTAGDSWYEQIDAGLRAMDAAEHDFGGGNGLRLESAHWVEGRRPEAGVSEAGSSVDLPDWLHRPVEAPQRPDGTLSPSDLGGAKVLPGEPRAGGGLDEAAAKLRGTRIHLLLEHLAGQGPESRAGLAGRLLGPDLDEPEHGPLLAEAAGVLDRPDLARLFGPESLAEVPITASLAELGGRRIHGTIDRLVFNGAQILAVDFKTNALVPASAEHTPEGLLRQMGAYASALEQIFPGREIETAILWTRAAQLMPLPEALVRAALLRAASP